MEDHKKERENFKALNECLRRLVDLVKSSEGMKSQGYQQEIKLTDVEKVRVELEAGKKTSLLGEIKDVSDMLSSQEAALDGFEKSLSGIEDQIKQIRQDMKSVHEAKEETMKRLYKITETKLNFVYEVSGEKEIIVDIRELFRGIGHFDFEAEFKEAKKSTEVVSQVDEIKKRWQLQMEEERMKFEQERKRLMLQYEEQISRTFLAYKELDEYRDLLVKFGSMFAGKEGDHDETDSSSRVKRYISEETTDIDVENGGTGETVAPPRRKSSKRRSPTNEEQSTSTEDTGYASVYRDPDHTSTSSNEDLDQTSTSQEPKGQEEEKEEEGEEPDQTSKGQGHGKTGKLRKGMRLSSLFKGK